MPAADPDVVAIDLVANLDQFDRTVKQSAQEFGTDMAHIKDSADRAERAVTYSMGKAGLSLKQSAQQTRLLGIQVGQVGSQLAAGTSPFLILAQQSSDFAYALQGTNGILGRAATFLSTWQGALLLAAGTVAATMLPRLIDFGDELEDEIDKLKEAAEKTNLVERAQEEFAKTIDGVTDALEENREALDKLNLVQESGAEAALKEADAQRQKAIRIRETTVALLEQAVAAQATLVEASLSGRGTGAEGAGAQAAGLNAINQRVADLEKLLRRAEEQLATARGQVVEARAAIVVEQAMRSAEERIEDRYDAQVDGAKRAAVASGLNEAALRKEVDAINAARAAELERYRASQRERRDGDKGDLGLFLLPVAGRTSGRFGERREGRNHAGIDIAVPVGTGVKASQAGTVITAGNLPGYGNVVIVDHGRGTTTRYAHLSQILTQKGAAVGQGEVLGLSGGARGAPGSGNSQGPHVHFEVRRGGRAVDPSKGQFPIDSARTAELAQQAAERAERTRVAEERRRQAFENELADLQDDEVAARQSLITSVEEIARLELQAIEISRQRYADNLDSLVSQKKLTDEEANQLRGINDERAKLRAQLVQRREDERKFRMAEADRRRALEFGGDQRADAADLLEGQADLARTQKERRDIERRLLDLQFAEERARNDYLIGFYERLKTQDGISESELKEAEAAAKSAELRNASIEQRQGNAQAGSDRSTAGPLESFFDDIPRTADEINEALEMVAAGGLATFVDTLTDAIVNFRSLGDVGLAVLQSLTAGLVKMALQQIILRTIGQTLGQATTAATTAQASAAAAAWAPAAAMASLATLGANAGPAAIALASTNALALGLAATSAVARRDGGPIGGMGGPRDDSNLVWASNGEYMIRASSARKLGRAALDRMNLTGEMPYGFANGGSIGFSPRNTTIAGGGGGMASLSEQSITRLGQIVRDAASAMPDVKLFPTLDPGAALRAALASPGGQRAMFDFVTDNPGGFRSALQQ